MINGKEKKKGDFFNPGVRRIVCGENAKFIFNYENIADGQLNHFCLIRFSYNDMFGNKY